MVQDNSVLHLQKCQKLMSVLTLSDPEQICKHESIEPVLYAIEFPANHST